MCYHENQGKAAQSILGLFANMILNLRKTGSINYRQLVEAVLEKA